MNRMSALYARLVLRAPRVSVATNFSTQPSAWKEGARLAELVASGVQVFVMANHGEGAQHRGFVDVRDIERHADGATARCFVANFHERGAHCRLCRFRLLSEIVRQGEQGGIPDDFLILEA